MSGEGYKDLYDELLKENALLLKAYHKVLAKLELAHAALTAARIPLPPEPDEDPEAAEGGPAEGGTRRRRRRHRRKRTSRA